MKNLSKNQKKLIILFVISTILLILCVSYLSHNLITDTIPALKLMDNYPELKIETIQMIVFNIFFQLVQIFFYIIALCFGIFTSLM